MREYVGLKKSEKNNLDAFKCREKNSSERVQVPVCRNSTRSNAGLPEFNAFKCRMENIKSRRQNAGKNSSLELRKHLLLTSQMTFPYGSPTKPHKNTGLFSLFQNKGESVHTWHCGLAEENHLKWFTVDLFSRSKDDSCYAWNGHMKPD